IVEHMAARLGICGISTEGSTSQLKPSIRISSKELEAGRLILKGYGLKDDDIIIGVAPGASFGSAKMYPVESFTKALTELAKELGARVVILGGPGDALLARELYTALVLSLDAKPINLVGVTSLREFMAITSTLKLFLTNDSGPMHVSAALGTPTVAIFGSTSPALTSPLGNRTALIYKGLSCSPCFKRECPLGHLNCLKNLPPSEVVEASLELYSEVSR
ncbi:MAG: lipopolysaccharide heptosyltransferase II, partial [Deltaproteobacteria bacterium]|nr:lipopolysaccharide heptosyltransferase II [Deltaproteobacteria bacterium]